MRARHRFLDFSGFMPDPAPDTLPSGAVSYGENIRQTIRGWEKSLGYSESKLTTQDEARHVLFFAEQAAGDRWFIATPTKIESFQGQSWADVTRESQDYSSIGEWDWNSLGFNGVAIFNNGQDAPQYLAGGSKFEDFPALESNIRFRVVRKFKNYLLGLGINTGGEFEDSKIYWSHPADPGTMPATWDVADPASDAGIFELSGAGKILDSLELGDVNIIYKSDSAWMMRFIGGQFIFRFEKKFAGQGILTTGCVTEFEGKHFVVTQTDIIVHDGIKLKSIADKRLKDFFLNDLHEEYYKRAFVVKRSEVSEIWFMYPSKNSDGYIDKALVWNWRNDCWEHKYLDGFIHGASGYGVPVVKESWDDMIQNWESDTSWQMGTDSRNFSPVMHLATKNTRTLIVPSINSLNLGKSVKSVWERQDIKIGPISRDGVVYQDYENEKIIRTVIFHVESGAQFRVYMGFRENLHSAVEWDDLGLFDPEKDKRLDLMETCGFLSLRIETDSDYFIIRGIDIEYELAGEIW